MTKMTRADLEEWASALSSGLYQQLQGALHVPRMVNEVLTFSFCCLGVLCKLQTPKLGLDVKMEHGRFCYDGEDLTLPKTVAEKFGCQAGGPRIPRSVLTDEEDARLDSWDCEMGYPQDMQVRNPDQTVAVSVLNDCNFSFSRIAELLLAHVEIIEEYPNANDTGGARPVGPGSSLWEVQTGQGKASLFSDRG